MKTFRAFFLAVYLIPLLGFLCVLGFNAALDPDHLFSQRGDYPFIAAGQRDSKIAGILNSYDVRNIVVGASLMNNTIPSEVEAATGWVDVYLLAKDASGIEPLSAITRYALRKHDIQNVVFALQPDQLARPSGADDTGMYLYDGNPLNDIKAFAQLPAEVIKSSRESHQQRQALASSLSPAPSDMEILSASRDLNANYMTRFFRDFNRPLFISAISDAGAVAQEVAEADKKNVIENYAHYIKPLVENNKNTQFHFLFPPGGFFSKRPYRKLYGFAVKFLVDELSNYPNVKIYGFMNDAFNADLRLYKDYDHFHVEVTRFMIQSLAKGDHLLTAKNIGAYLRDYDRILGNYKIPPLWRTEKSGNARDPYPVSAAITPRKAISPTMMPRSWSGATGSARRSITASPAPLTLPKSAMSISTSRPGPRWMPRGRCWRTI